MFSHACYTTNMKSNQITKKDETKVVSAYEILRAPQNISSKIDNQVFNYLLMARAKTENHNSLVITINPVEMAKFYDDGSTRRVRVYKQSLKEIFKKTATKVVIKSSRLERWKDETYNFPLRDQIVDNQDLIVEGMIIKTISYPADESVFTIEFNENLLPALNYVQDYYSSYTLKNFIQMNTKYGPQVYMMLQTWLSSKTPGKYSSIIWKIDDPSPRMPGIRQYLNLEHKFAKPSDLARFVLIPALEDINKNTDLSVQYKIHRSPDFLELTFTCKAPESLPAVKYIDDPLDTDFVAWRAIEMVNLLSGHAFRSAAEENISRIRRLLRLGYSPSQIISAPLRQVSRFSFEEKRLRPKQIFSQGENGFFDDICNLSIYSFEVLGLDQLFDCTNVKNRWIMPAESSFIIETVCRTICLLLNWDEKRIFSDSASSHPVKFLYDSDYRTEIEYYLHRPITDVDNEILSALAAEIGEKAFRRLFRYSAEFWFDGKVTPGLLLAAAQILREKHLLSALSQKEYPDFLKKIESSYENSDRIVDTEEIIHECGEKFADTIGGL